MDEATKVKDIIEDIVAANRILAAENVVGHRCFRVCQMLWLSMRTVREYGA